MQLASLKQHAVFNGIPFRKMAAETYKVVFARVPRAWVSTSVLSLYPCLNPSFRQELYYPQLT